MNLQTQYEVKGATQQWVASLMQQHNIPASIMVDALNSVLLNLKDAVIQEMFEESYRAATIAQAAQNKEEEKTDGESNIPD